jgi:hypothetical protein
MVGDGSMTALVPGGKQGGPSMAEQIAIGYPEEATAQQARDEVSGLT